MNNVNPNRKGYYLMLDIKTLTKVEQRSEELGLGVSGLIRLLLSWFLRRQAKTNIMELLDITEDKNKTLPKKLK